MAEHPGEKDRQGCAASWLWEILGEHLKTVGQKLRRLETAGLPGDPRQGNLVLGF